MVTVNGIPGNIGPEFQGWNTGAVAARIFGLRPGALCDRLANWLCQTVLSCCSTGFKLCEMRPVFYSFRRCPYAMRARLALRVSGVQVALREVVLRDKPQAFLSSSPSATVPCLVSPDSVIDESLDIMIWSLKQNDPEQWLDMPGEGWSWIERCDGPFKFALDRVKYTTRYPADDPAHHRESALAFCLTWTRR